MDPVLYLVECAFAAEHPYCVIRVRYLDYRRGVGIITLSGILHIIHMTNKIQNIGETQLPPATIDFSAQDYNYNATLSSGKSTVFMV